jgi:hypothetical protein
MMTRDAERQAYFAGYALGRARAERELAEMRRSRDELRAGLVDWRSATEERAAEMALVDFYRGAVTRRYQGVALH